MGRVLGTLLVVVLVIFGIAWAFGFVNLRQTRDAQLPAVHVEGGQAPKFDADVAKVKVGTKDTSVDVPKVEVGTTERKIEVPTVDVDKPKN